MKNPLLLAVFVLGIFLFVAFYAVSSAFYKHRHKQEYHFYQMFPYELNYPSVFKENTYGNVLFILASFAVAAFYILNPQGSIYKTATLIIAIVFTMVLICLILMPLYYLKTHMVLSITTLTLAMALPLFNFFMALSEYRLEVEQTKQVLDIISMVISAILALIMMGLILNPKLSFKIYMDKEIDSDGNEVLKRPKTIFLALSEWIAIFVYFLSPLAVILLRLI